MNDEPANPSADEVDGVFLQVMMQIDSYGDFVERQREAIRQHARAVEGVCGACGGTTYNGRCTNACR